MCRRFSGGSLSFIAACLIFLIVQPVHSHTPVGARYGMVVSSDALASAVGRDILAQGGNAVDAAVAVAYALAVTHPSAGNIGGGGFMLVKMADKEAVAIDYREVAPASASPTMYLDANGEVIQNASSRGPRSSGVPGTVAGLSLALERYGSLKLDALVAPAIKLAQDGFTVSYGLSASMADTAEDNFIADFKLFPASAQAYLKNGHPYQPGDTLRQPDLANTLRLIANEGPDAFYRGSIADRIDAIMKRDGGLITKGDLAAYRPMLRKPLTTTYRGYTVYTMPPPSSGGIILIGLLNVLEPYNLKEMGHNSSAFIHLFAEACNRYYADRAYFMGDPDFIDIPVAGLTSPAYAGHIRRLIDLNRHAPSQEVTHGDSLALGTIGAQFQESRETTHFSIVDRWGNAVSNTYTLNWSYGSRYVVEGTGILMNDEMDDFSIKPGVPNLYGLVGADANAIQPNKRMLSSMTPTIITKDNKPFLVVGSPGGSRIITGVCQTILNVIDHQMNVEEAVVASRVHSQWLPDHIVIEKLGVPRDVQEALASKGHTVVVDDYGYMGEVHAILVDPEKGLLFGAFDPRWGTSAAVGY